MDIAVSRSFVGVSFLRLCLLRRAVRKRVSMLAEAPKGDGDGDGDISGDIANADGERYGVTDFRSIARWKFAARPFLAAEEQAKMTIGVSSWLMVRFCFSMGTLVERLSGLKTGWVIA